MAPIGVPIGWRKHSSIESANMTEPRPFRPLEDRMNTTAVLAAPAATTALSVRNPWALVPPIGHLDAYISAVNRLPMLTAQEEADYARRLRDAGDLDAAGRLVLSHLRLVVSVARQYLGYGLPHGDLIQEGNVGLMKAVKRFDPEQGVRLVSYALHWIKAEIHEYILKNWRIVRLATTKAQRKLFFNLRSMKASLKGEAADGDTHRNTLSPAEASQVARQLNVKAEEVLEMETRLAGGDVALEPQEGDDGEETYAPIAYLADEASEPTRVLEARARDELAGDGIVRALDVLDARSRRIVEERWLKVNDDSSGGMTLHELAAEYGVSAERIRQIEVAAMKKMRAAIEAAH
jgi:RNA polymerase sigma-32 factor